MLVVATRLLHDVVAAAAVPVGAKVELRWLREHARADGVGVQCDLTAEFAHHKVHVPDWARMQRTGCLDDTPGPAADLIADHPPNIAPERNEWDPLSVATSKERRHWRHQKGDPMARADFAAELARRRARAGLSLTDLAAEAHAHRGYLSNVEHGHRWPSRSVALALDTALHADGELAALWETGEAAGAPQAAPDDFDRFERALAAPQRTDHAVVDHLARVLAEQRRAEDALGAHRLRPVTLAQIRIIETLTDDAPEPIRHDLLSVLSHYQQFAGWLGQDSMDAAGARRHYDRAMSAAQEIGDPDMATSVLSLLSHLAWRGATPPQQ